MCSERRFTRCGNSPRRTLFVGTALLGTLAGCEWLSPAPPTSAPGVNRPKLSPILERMRQTYPDLQAGPFISLADFESPGQVLLFRTVRADGTQPEDQPTLSILRSRNETGAGGLKAVLRGPGDRLVFDGARSTELALIRDWRPYALLLMSLYGPPGGVTLECTVASGETEPRYWKRTLRLKPQWNLVTLDVATIGDSVDLGDIRAVAWRAPEATGALELYVDDVILADNRRVIMGENAGPGELYAYSRGRRLHVGARDRFELAWADGVIVRWQDATGENLCDVGGLGPWPVPLPESWAAPDAPSIAYDDPQLFAAWGLVVAASQTLVEASPARVVVTGEWRWRNVAGPDGGRTDAPAAPEPGHRWTYTVYPSGALHVQVDSTAPPGGWGRPRVGYALGLDGRRGFNAPRVETVPDAPALVLLARPQPGRADLLWTWPEPSALPLRRDFASQDERRIATVVGDVPAAAEVRTVHLLRVWPADLDGAVEAASLAADYARPARVRVLAGRLVPDAAGDRDGDGFNEGEGLFELELADNVLRFTYDPGKLVRFEPRFRVHGTAGRACWVYARGRPVEPLRRDRGDRLLFELPRTSGGLITVEVHAAPAGG